MLHIFEEIYCIFLGQLGKITCQRHLMREIRHLICKMCHLTCGICLKISKKKIASDQMVKK